ncbi:PREDICTED: translation initiation factor IF-2-like [Ficedula albicollis]|uniref:translation initiation factor IF-2-like n=1 Tax=Ficedula albicollis TaxID=59894 RepID=UPI0003599A8A|nr:PREDICTED: translation initiation factor IF-2-like [Ficedula albicollis]
MAGCAAAPSTPSPRGALQAIGQRCSTNTPRAAPAIPRQWAPARERPLVTGCGEPAGTAPPRTRVPERRRLWPGGAQGNTVCPGACRGGSPARAGPAAAGGGQLPGRKGGNGWGSRVIPSAQHSLGLIQALCPHWAPGDRLANLRSSGGKAGLCGWDCPGWSREGLGACHNVVPIGHAKKPGCQPQMLSVFRLLPSITADLTDAHLREEIPSHA